MQHLIYNPRRCLQNALDSTIYHFTSGTSHPSVKLSSIIFICKGNICRSAFAEHLLREFLGTSASIQVTSCGLNAGNANSPRNAIKAAEKFGINLSGHISRSYTSCDLPNTDLILAMELWQYKELRSILKEKNASLRLLRQYSPFPHNLLCNIPDPYGLDERSFLECFNLIHLCVSTLVKKYLSANCYP